MTGNYSYFKINKIKIEKDNPTTNSVNTLILTMQEIEKQIFISASSYENNLKLNNLLIVSIEKVEEMYLFKNIILAKNKDNNFIYSLLCDLNYHAFNNKLK